MFLQFQVIKDNRVAFTIIKMLQVYVGKLDGFKRTYAVGTSIHRSSSENMVLNPTIYFLSAITRGSFNL